jgi:hypothetical protein
MQVICGAAEKPERHSTSTSAGCGPVGHRFPGNHGFVAHAFRRLAIESAVVQRWLRCGFAALFAGLGVKLGLSER